jgi:predicted nucleotidyltransferase component of viral defense system
MAERSDPLPHEDARQFIAALGYTAAQTGFSVRLIEKDYYCSIILRELQPLFEMGLVFKGGTALSKVYAGFHRLSEDLDFVISIDSAATQSIRRETIKGAKAHLQGMTARLSWITEVQPLAGANKSTQYNGTYAYTSHITGEQDTIKIEIGLREPVVEPVERHPAETILINPLSAKRALVSVPVVAMSLRESYAEKIRAALSRREPAIRDLFDLDHAIEGRILDVNSPDLLALAKRKLLVHPDEPSNVSEARFEAFRRQVETALQPVLRAEDFARFDARRVFALLRELDRRLR